MCRWPFARDEEKETTTVLSTYLGADKEPPLPHIAAFDDQLGLLRIPAQASKHLKENPSFFGMNDPS
jgi:hypothetical protein